MAINNGETQAAGFDIASEPVQFVWTFSVLGFAVSRRDFRTPTPFDRASRPSTTSGARGRLLVHFPISQWYDTKPTGIFAMLTLNRDFRTPKASLSPRRRRSATKFVWVGSGARSSDLPEHAVRVFPSLQVLNWGPSQFHHETFEHPRHRYPVRSILGGGCVCHLPHRTMALMRDTRYPFAGRSIVSLPAATADDAEDDVSEISWKNLWCE
ncbi:hypothetical protein CGCS363_v006323 [Colletotrichum siamense]|uniref:uncharacterized protein n=1 Tax=Colletotrichum siamense TaxID=690259 RepID=UPI00187236C5|nr:uncharacterized protein CGCS363_v006323 [Colletotrichum siamense]KAF5500142.1 hypothetical protein CGCS363_v006323 [Colletotrichum siamense]